MCAELGGYVAVGREREASPYNQHLGLRNDVAGQGVMGVSSPLLVILAWVRVAGGLGIELQPLEGGNGKDIYVVVTRVVIRGSGGAAIYISVGILSVTPHPQKGGPRGVIREHTHML